MSLLKKLLAVLALVVSSLFIGPVALAGGDCPSGYSEVDAGNGLVLCVKTLNMHG